MATTAQLRAALEEALAALPPADAFSDPQAATTAQRLRDRIARDLRPRLGGAHPTLLVGIAGTNNVGKSSLFNALVGQRLSPALPEGGLTKQCLAAIHPSAWSTQLESLLAQRYEVVPVAGGEFAPVTQPGPPGRLYLAQVDSLPPGLLVMDTPDFDSIYKGNRKATEALLVTVDLVIFVLSRQTYQNAALIDFLKDAVGQGRPYILLYNEASDAAVARGHLDKVAADIGQAPEASYLATYQPAVEKGEALIQLDPRTGAPPLRTLLADSARADALKARALAAALSDARAELLAVGAALAAEGAEPERLLSRFRRELAAVCERAARNAVPADVLIKAFQDELDSRSAFNRIVRRQARRIGVALTFLGRKLRESFVGPEDVRETVAIRTESALRGGLSQAIESMAPEVAAWRGSAEARRLLQDALGPKTLEAVGRGLELPELRDHHDEEALYRFCRELVASELTGGPREQVMQAATTLVYSLPVTAAGALTWVTGGMGHDAAVWIAAAVSTPVLERLVDLLGLEIREKVTEKWARAHGGTLAQGLTRSYFSELFARLAEEVESARSAQARLRAAAEALS